MLSFKIIIKKIINKIKKTDDLIIAIIIFLLIFSVLTIWQKNFWDKHIPGGDETIYLALAHNISYNYSIDLQKFLQEKQWLNVRYEKTFGNIKQWILSPPAPQARGETQFSIHNFGYPLIITIPYYIWGRYGVVILMQIVGALIGVNIYYLCRKITNNKINSSIVAIIMSLTLPLSIYSYLAFSDLFVALLISYAFLGIQKGWLSILAIAYLPWIKVKYLLQTLIFGVIYFLNRKNKIPVVLIIGVSLILLSIWFKYAYGSFSPFVIKGATGEFGKTDGLFGLILDWKMGLLSHSPYYLMIFPGITLLFLKKRKLFWQWIAIVLPYYLMIGLYGAWTGDHAPPCRHLIAILPLMAIPLIFVLENIKYKKIIWTIFLLLVLPSLVLSKYGIQNPGSLYIETRNNIGLILSKIFPNFDIARVFIQAGKINLQFIAWILIILILLSLPLIKINNKNIFKF